LNFKERLARKRDEMVLAGLIEWTPKAAIAKRKAPVYHAGAHWCSSKAALRRLGTAT